MARVSPNDATAEVFWTAFQALPPGRRRAVLSRMLEDRQFREDVVDLHILRERRLEPSRPLSAYLAARKKARAS